MKKRTILLAVFLWLATLPAVAQTYTDAFLSSVNQNTTMPCGNTGTATQQIQASLTNAALHGGGTVDLTCYQAAILITSDIFTPVSQPITLILSSHLITVNANATIPANFTLVYRNGSAIGAGLGYVLTDHSTGFRSSQGYQQLIYAPTPAPVLTPTTGGTFAPSVNLYYVVTATVTGGETQAGPEGLITLPPGQNAVSLAWTAVNNATAYKVYRGLAPGAENVSYASPTNSFTDTNAAGTAGAPPSSNTAWITAAGGGSGAANALTFGTTTQNLGGTAAIAAGQCMVSAGIGPYTWEPGACAGVPSSNWSGLLADAPNTGQAFQIGAGGSLAPISTGIITANKGIFNPSTLAGAFFNLGTGGIAPTAPNEADFWWLGSGHVPQWFDGTNTNTAAAIQAAPTSGNLAIFSGTKGVLSQYAGGTSCTTANQVATNFSAAGAVQCTALTGAYLPNPSASTLGGIESIASLANNWVDYISTAGVPHQSRPACASLSDSSTGCSTTVGTASTHAASDFLSSATVLPSSISAVASNFLTSYTATTGAFTQTRPACATLSDSGTGCGTNVGTAATHAATDFLANTTVLAQTISATANNFLNSYTATTGAFTQARPACATLSDSGTGCGTNVGTASTHAATDFAAFNASITINSTSCALGGSCSISVGTGTVTESGSPVAGNIPKFTTPTNIAPAAYTDITGLWTTCNEGWLSHDGTCSTPSGASFIFFLSHNAASPAVAGYLGLQAGSDSTLTTQVITTPANNAVLQNWITAGGVPGLSFIPIGDSEFHLHASKSANAGRTYQIHGSLVESDSSGADINTICTTENTDDLTNTLTEYQLHCTIGSVYFLASTASRITARITVVVGASGTTRNVTLYYGGTSAQSADVSVTLPGAVNASVQASTVDAFPYYIAPATIAGVAAPTVNGLYNLIYNVTASAAVVPSTALSGVPVNNKTSGSPYTLLYSDRASYLPVSGGSTYTITLPAAATNLASNLPFLTANLNSGNLTITPTTPNNIDGGTGQASATVLPNWVAWVYQDSNSPINWWSVKIPTFSAFPVCDDTIGHHINFTVAAGFICGTSLPAAATLTIASGASALGTGAITSGNCAAAVTATATGTLTTDTISYTPNGDPTGVTGYGVSATGAVLTVYAYPTAGNVNFKVCNSTSGAITPSALTLNWRVTR